MVQSVTTGFVTIIYWLQKRLLPLVSYLFVGLKNISINILIKFWELITRIMFLHQIQTLCILLLTSWLTSLLKQKEWHQRVRVVYKENEWLDSWIDCREKIEPFIDKSYQNLAEYVSAYDQKMSMKREVIADKGIWTAKKRYILNAWDIEGVKYKEPQLKIMGLEAVKSSTPAPCRQKIKDALKIIMSGNEKMLNTFIQEFREEFMKLPPEEIAYPRSLNGLSKINFSDPTYGIKKYVCNPGSHSCERWYSI